MLTKEASEERQSAQGRIAFTKMQALGNDFVVVDSRDLKMSALDQSDAGLSELARKVCNRNFGIGADGMIVVVPADQNSPDISWKYLNSDGSTSLMCGNGLRCVALYCVQNKLVRKEENASARFNVITGIGPVAVEFVDCDQITTDLGKPFLDAGAIPVNHGSQPVVKHVLDVEGQKVSCTCVGMGNPHCVIFESPVPRQNYEQLAVKLQSHSFFPQSANIEFVDCTAADAASILVWERGCGATLACASGAAAVLVAGVLEKRLSRSSRLSLPGGDLLVSWSEVDDHVRITGPARISFTGSLVPAELQTNPNSEVQ